MSGLRFFFVTSYIMAENKKIIEIKLAPDYDRSQLENAVRKTLGAKPDRFRVILQSLDARQKNNIHWQLRVEIDPDDKKMADPFMFPWFKRVKDKKRVGIIGSGPAGMYAALLLQSSGFEVSLFERGDRVEERSKKIHRLDFEGVWDADGNYCFGEGGAGTFSDGKLTSRTKSISLEKQYIFETFVECGAPEEILYLSHPHIGSNRLRVVVKKMRDKFLDMGGEIFFNEKVFDIEVDGSRVLSIESNKGRFTADYFIFATGNSAIDTWRMLIRKGVKFKAKPFAIGMRAEHPQLIINKAQWKQRSIKGLKNAEYALTDNSGPTSVYSFCMCPGGQVIAASAFEKALVVNGMSHYERNSSFANAAIVAAVKPGDFNIHESAAMEMIDKLENWEQKFYEVTQSLSAPSIRIQDFINGKISSSFPDTSYKHGLAPFDPKKFFPSFIEESLRKSLLQFNKKIPDYDQGLLLGFESKTSSPVQALRNSEYSADGFENLFIGGEGSGFSGGITSSAADGIKIAMKIINNNL